MSHSESPILPQFPPTSDEEAAEIAERFFAAVEKDIAREPARYVCPKCGRPREHYRLHGIACRRCDLGRGKR